MTFDWRFWVECAAVIGAATVGGVAAGVFWSIMAGSVWRRGGR